MILYLRKTYYLDYKISIGESKPKTHKIAGGASVILGTYRKPTLYSKFCNNVYVKAYNVLLGCAQLIVVKANHNRKKDILLFGIIGWK